MLLARLALVSMLWATPATAQLVTSSEACHNATFAMLDPSLVEIVGPGDFVEVWICEAGQGCYLWNPPGTSVDGAFGEVDDVRGCWEHIEDLLVLAFQYTCRTELIVELSGMFDSTLAAYNNETGGRTEVHTAHIDDSAELSPSDARTPAGIASIRPVTEIQNSYSNVFISDPITVTHGDTIGFTAEMVDGLTGWDLDMHNLLIEIRQLDPPCY